MKDRNKIKKYRSKIQDPDMSISNTTHNAGACVIFVFRSSFFCFLLVFSPKFNSKHNTTERKTSGSRTTLTKHQNTIFSNPNYLRVCRVLSLRKCRHQEMQLKLCITISLCFQSQRSSQSIHVRQIYLSSNMKQ